MAPLASALLFDGAARQVDNEVIGITAVLSRELLAQRKVAGLPNVPMCFASSWRRDLRQDVPPFLFLLESRRRQPTERADMRIWCEGAAHQVVFCSFTPCIAKLA